ncbi:hypothetical protein GCM10026982_52800 [Nocardiopsis aegyptia]
MERSRALEILLWACAAVCGVCAVITLIVQDNTGAAVVVGVAGVITAVNASTQRARRLGE